MAPTRGKITLLFFIVLKNNSSLLSIFSLFRLNSLKIFTGFCVSSSLKKISNAIAETSAVFRFSKIVE